MNGETANIIPYFQRRPGVLSGTLQRVFAQRNGPEIGLIIVDDESPAPAADEVALLSPSERAAITLIRQKNAGPGFARNVALDALPPTADWIALLDSDDLWEPDHLALAISTLRRGYDFYFTNEQGGGTATTFDTMGFYPSLH